MLDGKDALAIREVTKKNGASRIITGNKYSATGNCQKKVSRDQKERHSGTITGKRRFDTRAIA
uniref:Putative ovule protein n=1 Tax=Solanum chacoense TaxID=4108 RepID=A0A0V0HAI4_SOLCH